MSKIRNGQFKGAEFARLVWSARPEAGTTIEQLMQPAYWASVAEQLKPGARIEVMPEDGAYFAEFIVRSCTRVSAVVYPLRVVQFEFAEQTETDPEYFVKWRGPSKKWCVMRKSDNVPVIEDQETQELAYRELNDYLKVHKPRAA